MNKRDDKLVVYFDEDKIKTLSDWKRKCLGKYGNGGIKKRVQELVGEDLNKIDTLK